MPSRELRTVVAITANRLRYWIFVGERVLIQPSYLEFVIQGLSCLLSQGIAALRDESRQLPSLIDAYVCS